MRDILASRLVHFLAVPLAVLAWFVITDPSGGADTVLRLQLWAQALLVTGLAYLIAKAMLGKTSSEYLYLEAVRGNTAAGIAYLGVCILRALVLVGLLLFFGQVQQ
jgi:hypothetical protein